MNESLKQHVSQVARRLVDQLHEAESLTDNWQESKKGARRVSVAINGCLAHCTATGLRGREVQLPSNELWRIAGPILELGLLQSRARHKPRGYAGDDVMMQMIYEEKTYSSHPLGQLFDCYFQNQDAPRAVRTRINMAARAIADQGRISPRLSNKYSIVSVGSGSALDIVSGLKCLAPAWTDPVEVTLFDLDQQALDAAKKRLVPLLPNGTVRTVRDNLSRLPSRTDPARQLPRADLLLCLGLFDYLADCDAVAMQQTLTERLRPHGRLLVGNFSPLCKSRTYMEWFGNWFLIYRDHEALATLADEAGLPSAYRHIGADPSGANLILQFYKPANLEI